MREKRSAIGDQLSAGKLGSWEAGTPERRNAGDQERPLSDGACHASHFSLENLPINAPFGENASLATLGSPLNSPRTQSASEGLGWDLRAGTVAADRFCGQFFGLCI